MISALLAGAVFGFIAARAPDFIGASWRRRRALHRTLFDLLELRFQIRSTDPELFWSALSDLVADRFGAESVRELTHSGARRLVRQAVFRSFEVRSTSLLATYERAVKHAADFEPWLAYELHGGDAIGKLEHRLADYWARVHSDPLLRAGSRTKSILAAAEDRAVAIVMHDAMAAVSRSIERIARAAGPRTAWRARRALKRQDKTVISMIQLYVSQGLALITPELCDHEAVTRPGFTAQP